MFTNATSSMMSRFTLFICGLCLIVVLVGQTEATDDPTSHDVNATYYSFLPIISKPLGVPTSSPIMDDRTFLETFDGAPSSPLAWSDDNWDVTIHLRDDDVLYEMVEMDAHHGSNCEGPPATHRITEYEDAVYQCRNHVMTSLYGISDNGGYGLIYLTPNRLLDTSGDFSIHFDMSTFRANNLRDWVDIWLTPYEDNVQLAIHDFEPDLQGPPQRAVQIKLDVANRLELYYHENGQETKISPSTYTEYDQRLTVSKSVRSTFVIAVYEGILYIGLPDHNLWWYEQDVPSFMTGDHWGETVVQFGHHSYTPDKQCESSDNPSECGPNTYHWDNVALWPTKPFSMVQASPRLITSNAPTSKVLTLDSPAPSNAKLRFSGIGDSIDVSFNDGLVWQSASLQDAPSGQDRFFFKSYWTDIPEGTESVLFRGEDWTFGSGNTRGGEWAIRDATVWSLDDDGRQAVKDDANAKRVAAFLELKATSDVMTCAIPSSDG